MYWSVRRMSGRSASCSGFFVLDSIPLGGILSPLLDSVQISMMYYNDFFFSHFFFGPFFMIVFWALIIWGIVSFMNHISRSPKNKSNSAEEILKDRYAKGELTREQFETMKKDIQ